MKRTTEPLANHTWFKIGGPAEIVTPESKSELVDLLRTCHREDRDYRILGNGSNLLVSDEGIDELVIKNTGACRDINISDCQITVGASVMIPQFVNYLVNNEFGGYEYLYSVPGTVGGALFMNAGRSEEHGQTIADHLSEVEIFDGENVFLLSVDNLNFSHRSSIFQDYPDWTILTATFSPPRQPSEVGRRKVEERMKEIKDRERVKPNAGSVFTEIRLPLDRVPPDGLRVGDARFVHPKRICNDGDASFSDVMKLIRISRILHRLVPPFEPPEIELDIWE